MVMPTDDLTKTSVAVGTATVPASGQLPPPLRTEPMGSVLRWASTIAAQAGDPDGVDVVASLRSVTVSVSDWGMLTAWKLATGASDLPNKIDELGATIAAEVDDPDRWSVTIRAHVRTLNDCAVG